MNEHVHQFRPWSNAWEVCVCGARRRAGKVFGNPNPDRPVSHSKPKRNKTPTLGTADEREAPSVRRTTVRFVGYRVRPLDPDNFAGSVKDLLDGLRHAGLIIGDEPWRIRLETEQVKVGTYSQERTEISLTAEPDRISENTP